MFSSPLWEILLTPTMQAAIRVLTDLGVVPVVRSGCHRVFVPGGLGHHPHYVAKWFYTIQIDPRPGTPAFPATITLAIGARFACREAAMSDAALQIDPLELADHVLIGPSDQQRLAFRYWYYEALQSQLDLILEEPVD
ncbi:ORF3 [Bastrovirus 7]|uniref:ORF3 n=1 Tax=Bastrovirus 7 TaxID=1803394 RepID=UPI00076F2EB3|nr:ORF3 [Bastrovirus 7]AMD81619.1 ORF3 [Bastrovirus 7]